MIIDQINQQAEEIERAYRSGWDSAENDYLPMEMDEDLARDYIEAAYPGTGYTVSDIYVEAWMAGYEQGRAVEEEAS
jgi:hypothetical protein